MKTVEVLLKEGQVIKYRSGNTYKVTWEVDEGTLTIYEEVLSICVAQSRQLASYAPGTWITVRARDS